MARQGGCAGGHRGMSLSRARIELSFIVTVPIAPKGKPRAAVPWAYPLRVLPRLGSRESHR